MTVFKCLLRIAKRSWVSFCIYSGIFAVMIVIMAGNAGRENEKMYADASLPIVVFNRDDSKIGAALETYLATIHTIVVMEDDTEALQDEIFYRSVYHVIIIPEGFEESLIAGNHDVPLQNIAVPGSVTGIYVNMQVDQYMRIINTYLSSGFTLEEAIGYADEDVLNSVDVMVAEGNVLSVDAMYSYFQFLAYILLAIMAAVIAPIIMVFNRESLHKRMECSALKLRSKNFQITSGTIFVAFMIWVLYIILAILLYPDTFFTENGLYCLLNSFVFASVCTSIAYLLGSICKKESVIGAVSNVVSLGMVFLSGVFVSQDLLSESVIMFSKFLPAYWYVKVNNILAGTKVLTNSDLTSISQGLLIQLGFAAAVFAVTLVISRQKKMHPELA